MVYLKKTVVMYAIRGNRRLLSINVAEPPVPSLNYKIVEKELKAWTSIHLPHLATHIPHVLPITFKVLCGDILSKLFSISA